MSDFYKELERLINKHCMENESNTPDWILAGYIKSALSAFTAAVQQRETWYGRDARPSKSDVPGTPLIYCGNVGVFTSDIVGSCRREKNHPGDHLFENRT